MQEKVRNARMRGAGGGELCLGIAATLYLNCDTDILAARPLIPPVGDLLPQAGEGDNPYCANVLQLSICPLCNPVVSHFSRIADEPCVKLSGTA
jgi:hypothetical protein